MFSDEVTEDRSGWVNSEVYRDILAHIHPNGAKLVWRRFIVQMDNYPNTYSKCNPGVFEGKKVEYSQSPCLNPISLVKDKTKGKKDPQTTTEVRRSKDLAMHHKGGNPVSGDVHEF